MPPRTIRRIDAAAHPDTIAAIEHIMEHENVDEDEAFRRLIGYGHEVVDQPVNVEGARLLLVNRRRVLPDRVREVVVYR